MKSGTKFKVDKVRRQIKNDLIRDPWFINYLDSTNIIIIQYTQDILMNMSRLFQQINGKPTFLTDKQIESIVNMTDILLNKINQYEDPKIYLFSSEYIMSRLHNYLDISLDEEIYEYSQNISKLLKYYQIV